MLHPIHDIKQILEGQIGLYEQVLELETAKTPVIRERREARLEELCQKQEHLLREIGRLENERETHVAQYCTMNHLDDYPEKLTLKEIIRHMDEESAHQLMGCGLELKHLLMKISRKQDLNAQMLKDSVDLVHNIIRGLKDQDGLDTGYNQEGSEQQRSISSMLLNTQA